jgi:hypothetical protein
MRRRLVIHSLIVGCVALIVAAIVAADRFPLDQPRSIDSPGKVLFAVPGIEARTHVVHNGMHRMFVMTVAWWLVVPGLGVCGLWFWRRRAGRRRT